MKIAIRTDASSQIGTGHFMRCLTLADGLRQGGENIRFVCRHLPEYFQQNLLSKGYEFVLLDSSQSDTPLDDLEHSQWLGVSQEQDAADTLQALTDQTWDWLIIDHYAIDLTWQSVLRKITTKILVIDDIANRIHDCDVLLDQNYYEDMDIRYVNNVPAGCELLLGPKYALLRDDFKRLRVQTKPRVGHVKRILVFFGGIDAMNYTGRTIDVMSKIDLSCIEVNVVIGAQHPNRELINISCQEYGFICHIQTDRMAELMATADLSIGAGGAAIWERCCLGLPTLIFCTAENQRQQISDAAQQGLLYVPTFEIEWADVVKRHIIALCENNYLRQLMSKISMSFVDGLGVLRTTGVMRSYGLELRLATWDDSLSIFTWRNHPRIKSVSRNKKSIAWEEHQKWYSVVMHSQDKILLVGLYNKVPVGVVRFDKDDASVDISIYLVPENNNSGQGRNLLLAAENWIRENDQKIKHVRATVLGENEPSHKLFKRAGYKTESTYYIKQL